MTSVAITWQLYELTNKSDPLALGALGLAKAAPLIIFANVGGTVADAVDRRRLLMTTQAIFLCLSALLALATWQGLVSVPLLYGVAVATGAVTAFDNPARQALVVNLVSKEAVPRALTLWMSTFTVA